MSLIGYTMTCEQAVAAQRGTPTVHGSRNVLGRGLVRLASFAVTRPARWRPASKSPRSLVMPGPG
jgi:hypothetical protein